MLARIKFNTRGELKHQFGLKRFSIALVMVALFTVWGPGAFADESDPESRIESIAKFAGGFVSAYALHEVGHWAAAELTDTEIDFGAGRYNQPIGFTEYADSDTDGMIVHGSGLVTQLLVSEVILQADSIDKNDNFVRGMMFWNIVNPIIYALDYWFLRRTNQEEDGSYQGDIEGIENYSDEGSANVFAGVMVLVSLYQGYRYMKTQPWAPDWIKNETVSLTCKPVHSQGAMLTLHFRF